MLKQLCEELQAHEAKVSVAYGKLDDEDELPWVAEVWVAVDPSLRKAAKGVRSTDIASTTTPYLILIAQEYDETLERAVEIARESAGVTALLHYPERIRHWTFAKDDELIWVPVLAEQATS